MCDLAEAYINVRAKSVSSSDGHLLGKLNPGAGGANERHLLGIPLTHHPAFGNSARHASPLHFKVLKSGNRYQGVILHLPHKHSDNQAIFNKDKMRQIEVWKRVHQKLDAIPILKRTTMAGLN
jgi:CRISPR-associated protein Cmr1